MQRKKKLVLRLKKSFVFSYLLGVNTRMKYGVMSFQWTCVICCEEDLSNMIVKLSMMGARILNSFIKNDIKILLTLLRHNDDNQEK